MQMFAQRENVYSDVTLSPYYYVNVNPGIKAIQMQSKQFKCWYKRNDESCMDRREKRTKKPLGESTIKEKRKQIRTRQARLRGHTIITRLDN